MLCQSVLGIILGGGAGTRLYPLTKKRAKPAVPLGANYRLIDIPVSNCLNSNVSKIYVLTQFNSASLNRHLSRAYASNMGGYKNEGFVEVLAAQQSPENPNWFQVPFFQQSFLFYYILIFNYEWIDFVVKDCDRVNLIHVYKKFKQKTCI